MELIIKLDREANNSKVINYLKKQTSVRKIELVDDNGNTNLLSNREYLKSISRTSHNALSKVLNRT